MNILLLTLTDDPFDPPGHGRFGGAHAFFFDLARQFVRMGHDVTMATRLNAPRKPAFQDFGPHCRIHRLAVGPPEEIDHHSLGFLVDDIAEETTRTFRDHAFDVVQTSNWLSGAVACRAMPGLATRHAHHVLSLGRARLELGEEASPHDEVRDVWERTIFDNADALICVTEEEKEAVERLYADAAPKHVAIIPYGIDTEIFFQRPSTADDFVYRSGVRLQKGIADIP